MLFKSSAYRFTGIDPEILLKIKTIRIDGISKKNTINLDLKKGEIHAIMGESGAGKTGLAHILAGLKRIEDGFIYVNNQLVDIENSFDALSLGIGVLYDNLNYSRIPHLTVKEYLYLWDEGFFVSNKRLAEKTEKLLQEYEIYVHPDDYIRQLSVEECQLLALMKVLARNPTILVLDEPSSSLSEAKKQHLFRIIRKYCEAENGVLYLSSQLDEILQISDRVTILKGGGTLADFSIESAKRNPEKILGLYFGREKQADPGDDEFKDLIDTILQTTELLTSEYELQDLLNLLVEKITEITKAEACNILLMDEKSINVMECFHHSRPNLPEIELKDEIVQDVITSGEPLIINSITEAELKKYFPQQVAIKSLICVPIKVRSKINGAVELFYTQKKYFNEEDIQLLMTFATQVAIAVENTRLLGRSTLLKEAHHRIKNNLQSIITLLILQLQKKSEKDLESIVWQIIDRIQTIASVHEILSQDEKGIGLINFHNLIKLILVNYSQKDSQGKVETVIEIDDLYFTYQTATTLGLIVNELLANCFEHAFPDERDGRIILRLQHDDNTVYLQVIDNGVGFKDPSSSNGNLGLSLVKSLVSKDLRGALEIISEGAGTKVSIVFPKKQINY